MLARLVAFDTTSRNSNLELVDFVRDYLDGFGVRSRLVHDETGLKANLFATIGPEEEAGIVLSGHTDVVPVDGQSWNSNPFELRETDTCFFGRGTCDMKGFDAVILALVPEFCARDLRRPIHLSLTYDEELGCLGIRRLVPTLQALPVRPFGCIVGEPTRMNLVTAHKGKLAIRCKVRGFECHSSLAHRGVNAVEAGAEVVAHLKGMARWFRDNGIRGEGFDPPYTTVHTGVLRGGTAINIVPGDCIFDFEFRHLPEDDPDALAAKVQDWAEMTLLPEMQAVWPEAGFSWSELSRFPGLSADGSDGIIDLVKELFASASSEKVSYGTEAGTFQKCGIPAVVCGPGDIDQAHKPDEFIAKEQLKRCESFVAAVACRLAR